MKLLHDDGEMEARSHQAHPVYVRSTYRRLVFSKIKIDGANRHRMTWRYRMLRHA